MLIYQYGVANIFLDVFNLLNFLSAKGDKIFIQKMYELFVLIVCLFVFFKNNLLKVVKFRKVDTCFGLTWSTLICLGLHALSQITIERLKCSKAISGMDWMGISVGTDSKTTALRC